MLDLILYLIIGFVLGIGLILLILVPRLQSSRKEGRLEAEARLLGEKEHFKSQAELLVKSTEELKQDLKEQKEELIQLRQSKIDLVEEKERLKIKQQEDERTNREKLQLLTQARKELSDQFSVLANEILRRSQDQLMKSNTQGLESVLQPLHKQIEGFRTQLQSSEKHHAEEQGKLKQELEQLLELNTRLSDEANNLTKALKGEVKSQGTWGEIILERVLESSGLENGREYETQKAIKQEDGKVFYPDALIHLPDKREIIIDSKVSLLSYERLGSALSDQEKQAHLKEHINSLKNHIKGLSAKEYDRLPGIDSLDFVFMFIPIEGALTLALTEDEQLFRFAFEKNIILVSPSTLYVSLRTIENMWKQEKQTKNAQQIAQRAGLLYDKFANFIVDLETIGQRLDSASEAHRNATKKLSTGKGNLLSQIESIRKLGIREKKAINFSPTDEVD